MEPRFGQLAGGFSASADIVEGSAGENRRELVAADAVEGGGMAESVVHDLGNGAEHLVAEFVAMRVVHGLELIDVDEYECKAIKVTGVGDAFCGFFEGSPVAEAGERVGAGGAAELAEFDQCHGFALTEDPDAQEGSNGKDDAGGVHADEQEGIALLTVAVEPVSFDGLGSLEQ